MTNEAHNVGIALVDDEYQTPRLAALFAEGSKVAMLFNGTHTLENTVAKTHRTFRVRTQKNNARFAPGRRIVDLMIGPDNETSFKGIGFVNESGIKLWMKQDTEQHRALARCLWSIATLGTNSPYYAKGLRMHTSGTCIKCNRKLTTPESIKTGIGPICAGRR